jgi:hypothetical protein
VYVPLCWYVHPPDGAATVYVATTVRPLLLELIPTVLTASAPPGPLTVTSSEPIELGSTAASSAYVTTTVWFDPPPVVTSFAAIAAVGAEPAATAMIGDTAYDMAMARAAGARAIGVAWGYHSPEELREAGAEAVAESPGELAVILEGLR